MKELPRTSTSLENISKIPIKERPIKSPPVEDWSISYMIETIIQEAQFTWIPPRQTKTKKMIMQTDSTG